MTTAVEALEVTDEIVEPLISLTLNDRCDGCRSAAAVAVARKEGFSDLMFCFHDRNKHEASLLGTGWTLIDDQAAIDALK